MDKKTIYFIALLVLVFAITIVFGMFGHCYLQDLALYNRFIAWEITAIGMSILINLVFYRTNKTWQIAFYITEEDDKPVWYILLFAGSLLCLGFAELTIFYPYILRLFSGHEEQIQELIKINEYILLVRLPLILGASALFWSIDSKVSKTATLAKRIISDDLKIKKKKKESTVIGDKKLATKIKKRLKLKDEAVVTYEHVEEFISILSSSFRKSCRFNDCPVCIGFFILLLNVGLMELGKLKKCGDGELSIWICGASAFQLMASGIVFAVIITEVFEQTLKLKEKFYGTG